MKNTLKFDVGVRLMLAIVLCLSTKAHASTGDGKARVFVFACDEFYTGPTATAIQSLQENNPYEKKVAILTRGVTLESREKLEQMKDDVTSIFVIDLDEKRWEAMPAFEGGTIDLIASVEKIGEGQWGDVVFRNEQNGNKTYKFWVNLRFFFPEIWASGFLPEELRGIDSFLLLDSDLIVLKDLSNLFEICKKYPHQPMISANLLNEGQCPEDPTGFDSHFGSCQKVNKADMSAVIRCQCAGSYDPDSYLISGGVVFWRVKKIIKKCEQIEKNVFQNAFSELKAITNEVLLETDEPEGESTPVAYRFFSEEYIFTHFSQKFLFEEYPEEQFVFLSPLFNMASPGLLRKGNVTIEDIFIFHWDTLPKPWAKKPSLEIMFFPKNSSDAPIIFFPDSDNDNAALEQPNALWREYAKSVTFYLKISSPTTPKRRWALGCMKFISMAFVAFTVANFLAITPRIYLFFKNKSNKKAEI
jgi:hypothetical protein